MKQTYHVGIDIVVVNFRTPDDLGALLQSIEQFPPAGSFTVTVVQVQPTGADRDAAKPFLDRHRSWVQMCWETNVGYNVACNEAARCQPNQHEFVAFLNADTRTTEGAFDELCIALIEHPDWAIVGPRQVDSSCRITAGGIFGDDEHHAHRGWHEHSHGQFDDVRDDATFVAGSFFVMRRSVFDELTACEIYRSLVDESGPMGDFVHYCGDKWVGVHARAHGHRCAYYGPVCVFHEWHHASPVGGHGEHNFAKDEQRYRDLCEAHDWPHN